MTEPVVTAAELGSHLVCPRQYEFEHDRPVSPRPTSKNHVRERRRELLRQSVIAGLQPDSASADDRIAAALARLEELWTAAKPSYVSDDQSRYDEDAVSAAIERYFSTVGHGHGERLVDADTTLGYDRDGIRYETTVDAVVERDGAYLAIRYVPDTNGLLNVDWYDDNVEQFTEGRAFYPRQIASFVRAGIAIGGLRVAYGLDVPADFAYVSLLEECQPDYAGDGVQVEIAQRHFADAYETEREDLLDLAHERASAILDGDTDPRTWRFDAITDRCCRYCAYRDACPDYLAAELSVVGDRRPETTGSAACSPTEPTSGGEE
ncbi:hypothetical protein ACLI4Z_19300 [Natrialbaceae archaeon A-arb3/5]